MRNELKAGILFCMILLVYSLPARPQTGRQALLTPPIAEGSFIWQRLGMVASTEITDLLRQQYEIGRKAGTVPGYRLQLYFGSGVQARSHAEKVKADFTSLYPETKVYLIFKSPDFIVRAGDFRTKSEALKVQKVLNPLFSNAFIVSDEISFHLPPPPADVKIP